MTAVPFEQVQKALGILGLPSKGLVWLEIDRYEIEAKYEDGTSVTWEIDLRPAWERDRA